MLFDGLDEVPTEAGRSLVSRLVESFVNKYPNNRYVVTSRVRGYTGDTILRGEFVRCDIQSFNSEDRSQFLQNWFAALLRVPAEDILHDSTDGNREFEELRKSIEAKDRIKVLAINPLLMTVIAIVHWNRKRLPDQRVDLYDECVDVLLGQRKLAERVGQADIRGTLDENAETGASYDRTWTRKRFGEIALLIMQSGFEEEITRDSVVEILVPRFLARGAESFEVAEFEADQFLDSQELRSGLLVSRKSKACRFVHLTFQEYLAAWNLASRSLEEIKPIIRQKLREPQWFESLQLLGGELARSSDEKLDTYISFLLQEIGDSIGDQAPIIALCANILSDVKGVAEIETPTRQVYASALENTLEAFRPYSGVPATTQLEVLDALAELGGSVKEHLMLATQSSYYAVRARALHLLVVHLNDDDLFSMVHIFNDRSQEPIFVYVTALLERDSGRAISLIKSRQSFSLKEAKAVYHVMRLHIADFSKEDALRIFRSFFGSLGPTDGWYYRLLVRLGASTPSLREDLKKMLFELSESIGTWARWNVLDLLVEGYIGDSEVNDFISRKAVGEDSELNWNALYLLATRPGLRFSGRAEDLRRIVFSPKQDTFNRQYATRIFLQTNLTTDSIERTLLSDNLDGWPPFKDLSKPIPQDWIAECAKHFGESNAAMILRFKRLRSSLGISVDL
jgi:hypothetical protein